MLPLRAVPGQFGPEVREPGLRTWRVEKMKAVPLEPDQLGVFFNGDAYLVLSTHGAEGTELHMWMGEKSSRDEQGACAMLAIQLDHFLGGHPVQHRQVQGYETPEFMSLFPAGLSYKEGGVESGFRRAQMGSGPVHHLYQVKGKRNVRAKEVELSWKSFNKGDCFVLDLGETIVSWSGSKSNMFERQKVREFAALIRDTERHSKAQIIDAAEGEEPLEMIEALGLIPRLMDSTPEDDTQTDILNFATLYKVSDATGSMSLTMLSDKSPFCQEFLERDDCFILDNGNNGKIYIWKGHGANSEERMMSLKIADQFIQRMNYPLKTQVEILPQGRESILFKQFFQNWS
ncbi:macrophage-capping protein-like isoform X2 [Clupea harengus]|uniref:Macrophage-capping protein-like isoform X2 n=1 Tax=Clupea harengus TaxID=7950 RepID=A0A6P8FYH5_CLUHA|nr:macrophage-capping protein-like isoform X2 [Clupea harengus]XP_031428404.1 macrophage-capping protein-like isoform X2 [Clupea harengus]XP_031428405.1 macrophage-capping protein-like isoform X2 [Clupea harengus]